MEKQIKLSQVQQQFWLQNQSDPESSVYNMVSLFEVSESLDVDVTIRSLEILVDRFDVLRSRIVLGDDGPVQLISDSCPISLRLSDYSREDLENEINTPFDIEKGPLFRFSLFRKNECFLLLFVFHHLVIDLRSKDIFAEDFSSVYSCLCKGEELQIKERPSYEHFAEWSENFLKSDRYRKMLTFWQNEELVTEPLNLFCDFDRKATPSTSGTRILGELSTDTNSRLMQYCNEENSDPFIVLLSAYYLLLHKYSGQDNISIGVPRTNRPDDSFVETFGCFVNILPMVIHFSDDLSFAELRRQVRKKMLLIHRNQHIPYLHVIKTVKDKIDRKYNPLFQVGFTSEHPMELALEDLDVKALPVHGHGSQLDLFLNFWQRKGSYHWEMEYNSDLFTEERVRLYLASFETILQQIINGEDFLLSDTHWISGEWNDKVCREWNRTEGDSIDFEAVHKLFEQQAAAGPERTALRFQGRSCSFGELNERANTLAHVLIRLGAGPESIIGLSVERSFEMVVGLLGILKAGASYMPMEPTHPDEYKKYLVEDTKLSCLLTKKKYQDDLAVLFPHLSLLSLDDESQFSDSPKDNPQIKIDSNSRAYLFYTSGSTGQPKGVEVEHGGLADRILWMDKTFDFGRERKTLLKTPYNFDVSGMEFWLPLTTGAPLVIADPEGHWDNSYLAQIIKEENISILHFVPSLLNIFLNSIDAGSCPMVEHVLCCGEALPANVVNKFYEKMPNARLGNLYGPTEATIFITYWDCQIDCSVVPIGRPVTDTQVYVLDKKLKPLPPGVQGDLYLAGSGLARGYFNRQELTDKVFKEHFLQPQRKMYLSGDLAQWTMDGELLYFGRSDSQVQLHGQRIELGEIESTLNSHKSVKNSAVIVEENEGDDKRLVAYLVRDEDSLDVETLKRHILKTSPKYMVPSLFYFLEELPLSSNGKLDRKKLPRDLSPERNRTSEVQKVEGELEKRIAGIWEHILKVKVGPRDNFFDLGGTSLQLMELHKELTRFRRDDIPMAMLFRYNTVETLAAFLKHDEDKEAHKNILSRAEKQKKIAQRRRRP